MTIFEFSDFRSYMRYRLEQRNAGKKGHRKSTITRLASSLGYTAPSIISMVLRGKRLPSVEFCSGLGKAWAFSKKERQYFSLLVELERRKLAGEDPTETVQELQRVSGHRNIATLEENEFSSIREWYYIVIRQLVETIGFKEDPSWISKILRRKVSAAQAEEALVKLQSKGVLVRNKESGKLVAREALFQTTHDVPSAAIRMHHRGMLERALEALEDRPVQARYYNALTLTLDAKRVGELRKRLDEVVESLLLEYGAVPGDSVHQICLQFFEHTHSQAVSNEMH